MLRLNAEQKARSEGMNRRDARGPGGVTQVDLVQIAVSVDYQPPDDGKHEPTEEEVEGEHQQGPPPLSVHQSGEDVLQEETELDHYAMGADLSNLLYLIRSH
jgi:hypothetical protein